MANTNLVPMSMEWLPEGQFPQDVESLEPADELRSLRARQTQLMQCVKLIRSQMQQSVAEEDFLSRKLQSATEKPDNKIQVRALSRRVLSLAAEGSGLERHLGKVLAECQAVQGRIEMLRLMLSRPA